MSIYDDATEARDRTEMVDDRETLRDAVVVVAREWRAMRADTPTTPKPESAALIAAVDALDGAS